VADVHAAFTAGNCAEVLRMGGQLPDPPDASDPVARNVQACQRFEKAVRDGDKAFDAALQPGISTGEKRQRSRTAVELYTAAIDQRVPGAEADRIRKRLDDMKKVLEAPAAPVTPVGRRSASPVKPRDESGHEDDRQSSKPPPRRGREPR